MSDPKLISPMLDNFDMGDPISEHDSVRCCPAMHKDSNDKYIVKIISVPASRSQIDALILSGAYSSQEEAVAYFKTVANEILLEAEALKALSKLEGFVAFEQWQIEPMDDGAGYDVYLLGTYKTTLEKALRTDAMTQLNALNLGLDLCAALSVCRRSGYLYVDLKPDNIYLTEDHGYRIGDLGLLKLDSLKYASLPDRYRSRYTCPEIVDAFSALNTTIDVYAVGMILYQVFNGGVLPAATPSAEAPLPAPDYADYEMAEIILKACAPDPNDRWQDPVEMGQAIVSYMQRNGAHDVPIVPVPEEIIAETISDEDPISDADSSPDGDNTTAIEATTIEPADNNAAAEDADDARSDESHNTAPYAEDDEGNLSFILDDPDDETLPGQSEEELDYEQVSEEVSDMLNQADDLIAHPTPDPVVAPDPIDVPIPPPLPVEPAEEEVPEQTDTVESADPEEQADTSSAETDNASPEDSESETPDDAELAEESEELPKPRRNWLRNSLLILIGLILIAGGIFFYKFYFLREVSSLVLQGSKNYLTVYVTSEAKDTDLTVVCSDTYGNKLTKPVVDGAAYFDNLAPNTPYTVKVEIDGFHKLTGKVSTEYTTPPMTTITQFSAVTGQEDGSAILTIATDGPGTSDWKVQYTCEDESERQTTFSGAMTTINGLTIGKTYTFTLTPVEDIYVTGPNEIQHTASKLILAEDLLVTSCYNGILTAQWSKPENADVNNWTVRCYNDKGYNEVIVTNEPTVTFEGITDSDSYSLEVLAAGMSVSKRLDVTENSITVVDFTVTVGSDNMLELSWNSSNAPEATQWSVLFAVENAPAQKVAVTEGTKCTIPLVPDASYTITLQAESGSSVLGGQRIFKTEPEANFNGYGVDSEHIEFKMCVTPKNKNWDRYDVDEYTTTFSVGEKASFVVRLRQSYKTSSDKIQVLYVIRNQDGKIVSYASTTQTWKSMWRKSYGEFDIPNLPDVAGDYSIAVYFNGACAGATDFTIEN